MDNRTNILVAARKVFAKEGYKGASISKIAREANLKSHSLIYWYFKDKKDLFNSVIDEYSPVLNQLPKFWTRIDDPPEEVLLHLLDTFLTTFDYHQSVQFFSIILSEASRDFEMINNIAEKLLPVLSFVVSYFNRQVELGRLRPHNTQSSARSFVGTFIVRVIGREFFLPLRVGLPEKDIYIRDIVGIFLHGLKSS